MATVPIAIFWLCSALLIYTHVGYPAVLWLWARRWPHLAVRGSGLPKLTVVVVAHNEGGRIEARVENLLMQNYPHQLLTIAIGSDGSTDDTVERARSKAKQVLEARGQPLDSVKIVEFGLQRGKPAVLNELVPASPGAIVVLADARQRFEADALRWIVGPFADPQVGAVSGELLIDHLPAEAGGDSNGGLYWTYEKFLRRRESRIDSTVGATGAIYAIRRELFETIPIDTVLDDMLIPSRIAQRGYRVVFEARAVAHDRSADPANEFQRKARTLAGNFQLFSREQWLLNPRKNRLWVQTVSHKLLRLACPLFLLGTLVCSAVLARRGIYRLALIVQLALYAAALVGMVLSRRGKKVPKLLSAAYLFCLLHWATVVGFVRFARGQATPMWKHPPRVSAHASARV